MGTLSFTLYDNFLSLAVPLPQSDAVMKRFFSSSAISTTHGWPAFEQRPLQPII